MRTVRLNSREKNVLRCLDEVTGSTGAELEELCHIDKNDLLNILQGLLNTGLLEAYLPGRDVAVLDEITFEELETARFEVNPGFAQELKQSMRR